VKEKGAHSNEITYKNFFFFFLKIKEQVDEMRRERMDEEA